jgi:hypothetical protein
MGLGTFEWAPTVRKYSPRDIVPPDVAKPQVVLSIALPTFDWAGDVGKARNFKPIPRASCSAHTPKGVSCAAPGSRIQCVVLLCSRRVAPATTIRTRKGEGLRRRARRHQHERSCAAIAPGNVISEEPQRGQQRRGYWRWPPILLRTRAQTGEGRQCS